MTRLAILGRGQMGTLIASLASAQGFMVVAHLDKDETENGVTAEALKSAEVVIEFTTPSSAARLVRDCLSLDLPVVSGTTGWDKDRAMVEMAAKGGKGALLWAPNFALGVHLFGKLVAEAARSLAAKAAGYTPRMVETHHTRKLDAPSGTAKLLASIAEQSGGKQVPIESVREGDVVGTHEIIFDGAFDDIRLVHTAHDRRVFAAGALAAAAWLKGKRGLFTLDDFLTSQAVQTSSKPGAAR
jgi:4-hydroxy-tetrahydrodipicolinate reductase